MILLLKVVLKRPLKMNLFKSSVVLGGTDQTSAWLVLQEQRMEDLQRHSHTCQEELNKGEILVGSDLRHTLILVWVIEESVQQIPTVFIHQWDNESCVPGGRRAWSKWISKPSGLSYIKFVLTSHGLLGWWPPGNLGPRSLRSGRQWNWEEEQSLWKVQVPIGSN